MIYAVGGISRNKQPVAIGFRDTIDTVKGELKFTQTVNMVSGLSIGDMVRVTLWNTTSTHLPKTWLEQFSGFYVIDEFTVKLLTKEDIDTFNEI